MLLHTIKNDLQAIFTRVEIAQIERSTYIYDTVYLRDIEYQPHHNGMIWISFMLELKPTDYPQSIGLLIEKILWAKKEGFLISYSLLTKEKEITEKGTFFRTVKLMVSTTKDSFEPNNTKNTIKKIKITNETEV